jgi:hypothetical protein
MREKFTTTSTYPSDRAFVLQWAAGPPLPRGSGIVSTQPVSVIAIGRIAMFHLIEFLLRVHRAMREHVPTAFASNLAGPGRQPATATF